MAAIEAQAGVLARTLWAREGWSAARPPTRLAADAPLSSRRPGESAAWRGVGL